MKETWSGIDVSKQWFDASWVPPETRVEDFALIPHRRFDRTPQGVRQFIRWLHRQGAPQRVRIVMEATGSYSLELTAWLVAEQPELAPAIINPKPVKHFHQSLGLRNRTDPVDARSLGLFGKERRPQPFKVLPAEYLEIRGLMRQRRDLIHIRVAEKQRLDSLDKPAKSVRRLLKSHLLHLEKLLQRIDRDLQKVLAQFPQLRHDLQLLLTIPGVGRITALTILGELGDLRRYRRSRDVSALSGLSPRIQQSGSSKNFSYIDRNGHPEIRAVLYMAALSGATAAHENRLSRTYHHLLQQDKTKKQALVAVARKTLVIMRALLITDQPYIDDFQKGNARG